MEKLLDVRDLRTYFYTYRGVVKALNGVYLTIKDGEVVGLVGETGSGKSVTARSIMRLIDPPGRIVGGNVFFEGRDLLKLSDREMMKIRGRKISMIFQEPIIALNPVLTIRTQIIETIMANRDVSVNEAEEIALELLEAVGLPNPKMIMKRYPFELSGGMAQRVFIAMAISANPRLLIADEPTSSLDVTIQAQILDLLNRLMEEGRISSMLYITHDLGVAAELCHRIAVMYGGRVIEFASTEEIFKEPLHPYTRSLLKAIPRLGYYDELYTIPGRVPDLVNPPSGCMFHPRCPYMKDVCKKEIPEYVEIDNSHYVACHFAGVKDVR